MSERPGIPGPAGFADTDPPGRISIPALREQIALESDPDQPRAIYQAELEALVEAVEAAWGVEPDGSPAWDRLAPALARFDFGEET